MPKRVFELSSIFTEKKVEWLLQATKPILFAAGSEVY